MRQIHACAWIALSLAACGGEEFSTPSSTAPYGSAGRAGSLSQEIPPVAGSGGGAGGTASSVSGDPEIHNAGAGPSAGGESEASGGEGTGGADSKGPNEPASDCPNGVVTFRMLPSEKLEPDYLCDAGCGTAWLSITDKEGATGLPISSACGTASCEACEVRQCAAAACLATPLTTRGSEITWDGAYLAKDTCGQSQMVCQRRQCVKAGKYKARACAAVSAGPSVGGSCTPNEEQLCAEVEFEFPATQTVELILGR
jgi:hypothetical protein